MKTVNLASGGLDSSVASVLIRDSGDSVLPLFVDYGQRSAEHEWKSCLAVHSSLGLPAPTRVDLRGYGELIQSGLTTRSLDIVKDAFTPGRNLLLLLVGSAFAHQVGADRVCLGLLSGRNALFPDQTDSFVSAATTVLREMLGYEMKIVLPLRDFSKADVVQLARELGVVGTYSCHSGMDEPCGVCISCKEFDIEEA